MRRARSAGVWVLLVCVCLAVSSHGGQSDDRSRQYKKGPGPYEVGALLYDWLDQKRNRAVPVKIYYPKAASQGRDLTQVPTPDSSKKGAGVSAEDSRTSDGSFPIIIFSHGLGGSREGYEYLGRHWASHGYVCVHLQHKGSDNEVWQGNAQPMESLRRAAASPLNAINRPLDVRFAIDQMEEMDREESPFKGRLDLGRIGMAGHSFGAYTTLAVAGQVFAVPFAKEATLADLRVKAAIPMSAPVPQRKDRLDQVYGRIAIPCLHMTGTLDTSPIGDTTAEERRVPFDHINGADQFLITFKDGDHMIFSGRRVRGGNGAKDAVFHDLILMSSTAFWDAYLRNNASAKAWLADGAFENLLDSNGQFEKKIKSR